MARAASGSVQVRATVESYCTRSSGRAQCVDSIGLTKSSPALPVSPGGTVAVGLGAPALRVTAWIARVRDGFGHDRISSSLPTARSGRGGRRWSIRLPTRLPAGNTALRWAVRYQGFSPPIRFDVPLRPVR
jgi:hypothetical protein